RSVDRTRCTAANGVFAVGLPYSTLGVGVIWLPSPRLQVVGTLSNAADSSTTSGFEDFGDGWLASVEAQVQLGVEDLPGGIPAGGFYIGDANFLKINGRLSFSPGEGLVVPTQSHDWCVYGNAWQYVLVKDKSDAPIDLSNGTADRQGLGLFARAGVSDDH